ncbi:MotA/TolQ/ExbB proton channel family protein [Deltaproteobacteria bacterium OttesenSCG-928-M10]|nr:MotA/TolQ/ExbB proton channel family protein [Deltaproteobacteria bacterium OttesenSCG-928-M10]
MEIGALLKSAVYIISSSLLYPAMAVLLIAFIALVVGCGSFLAEWAERARLTPPAPDDWPAILHGRKTINHYLGSALDRLQTILNAPNPSWAEVENLWQSTRRVFKRKLDYLRILVRVGPSMGLIGTLIPMSTGLAALSQGDMSRLSADLVIAFTTTVVGLAVGVTAYVLYTIRSRWLESDLEVLQLVMESRAARVLDRPEKEARP